MPRFLAVFILLAALGARAADLPAVERSVIEGTNRFRQSQGLGPVHTDSMLDRAARDFAQYLAATDRFEHTADGRTPAGRAQAKGYEYCLVAENIAYEFSSRGFTTAALANGLVDGWIKSPGHRKNMLDARAVDTGVAVVQSVHTGRFYAVQMFGRRRAACS
jgi:uncharacterized protein YkwD